MTPEDYAGKIVPIDEVDGKFVVSVGMVRKVCIGIYDSERLAQACAGQLRADIATVFEFALCNERCRMAAEIDEAYLSHVIDFPSQAATLCRNLTPKP